MAQDRDQFRKKDKWTNIEQTPGRGEEGDKKRLKILWKLLNYRLLGRSYMGRPVKRWGKTGTGHRLQHDS